MDTDLLRHKLQQTSLEEEETKDSDRRHLLSESIAPSSSASQIYTENDEDPDRTPRARSPARSARSFTTTTTPSGPRPYRGFPSEAAYLAALQQFVDSKKYVELGMGTDVQLIGFYGKKTSEEIIASQPAPPDLSLGFRRKWRARKVRKAEEQEGRRGSEVGGGGVVGGGDERERRNTVA